MCVIAGDAIAEILVEAAPEAFGLADAAALAAGGLGVASSSGAFGGADSTTAGLDTSGVPAGAGDQTAILADSPGGLAQTQDLAGVGGGAGQTSATLAPPSTTGAIPELTVTAPSTAGAPDLSSAIQPLAASGLAAAGAGGGGSGVPGAQPSASPESSVKDAPLGNSGPPTPADIQGLTAGAGDVSGGFDAGSSGGFLPATGDSSVQALSPDVMQSMGISPSSLGNTSGAFDASSVADPSAGSLNIAPESFGDKLGDAGSDIGKWLKNPKNAATAGMLGLSLKNSLSTPKLPGASAAAEANAAAVAKGALPVIESGGTASPAWASQKASIDSTIDNEIKQQTQAIMQAAASSGEGGQNSGIVQQQIAQMTQQANLQRQQLYAQAQAQNVQQAISELTGGDATLAGIGQMQAQQSEQASQLAAETASLALQLQGGSKWPGQNQNQNPPSP
jgi:hypothetical protein